MGQKDHNITLEEMENGIIGCHGQLAEVGRRIERIRRNAEAKDLSIRENIDVDTALSRVHVRPIGWDSVKRALEKYELQATLQAEKGAAISSIAFNMLDRAVTGDILKDRVRNFD